MNTIINKKFLLLLLGAALILPCAQAFDGEPNAVPSVEQAFILQINKISDSAQHNLEANWVIAPGTYLYQSRIKFQTLDNTPPITSADFPAGEDYNDIDLGKQIIYKTQLAIPFKLSLAPSGTAQTPLSVHYQGCAEVGFCYPPQTQDFIIKTHNGQIIEVHALGKTNVGEPNTIVSEAESVKAAQTISAVEPGETTEAIPALFKANSLFTLLSTCFAIGLALCFTPCVLPMVPMLSTLIVGKKNLKTFRAFSLSSVYVLSMSATYALAGILAALLGQRIQTAFQSPWILSAFAGLFVILGLELAGHLNISMPDFIKSRLYQLQAKPHSGTFLGAAALGVLATLIASPCVSAPLMGVLGYITQTGDVLVGGLSLFAIGLGMGIPLVIAGTLGGKYLPKAGPWMQIINYVFAIVLFGFAIWILERFLPSIIVLPLWALLCLYIAYRMGSFHLKIGGVLPRFGVLFVVYSGFLMLGTFQGASDPLRPLAFGMPTLYNADTAHADLSFNTLSSVSALESALDQAKQQQQPTLVKFYADWCTSCKHMDKNTFSDPSVQAELKNWHLVRANVTENQRNEQALLKKFQLLGPPSLLFFNKNGQELTHLRLIGEIPPKEFIAHLKKFEQCEIEGCA